MIGELNELQCIEIGERHMEESILNIELSDYRQHFFGWVLFFSFLVIEGIIAFFTPLYGQSIIKRYQIYPNSQSNLSYIVGAIFSKDPIFFYSGVLRIRFVRTRVDYKYLTLLNVSASLVVSLNRSQGSYFATTVTYVYSELGKSYSQWISLFYAREMVFDNCYAYVYIKGEHSIYSAIDLEWNAYHPNYVHARKFIHCFMICLLIIGLITFLVTFEGRRVMSRPNEQKLTIILIIMNIFALISFILPFYISIPSFFLTLYRIIDSFYYSICYFIFLEFIRMTAPKKLSFFVNICVSFVFFVFRFSRIIIDVNRIFEYVKVGYSGVLLIYMIYVSIVSIQNHLEDDRFRSYCYIFLAIIQFSTHLFDHYIQLYSNSAFSSIMISSVQVAICLLVLYFHYPSSPDFQSQREMDSFVIEAEKT